MLNSTLCRFQQLSVRMVGTTPILSSSVFMKKQKKMDPEVAQLRENRKRRKLTREIRDLQKEGKKPKPVLELSIDEKTNEIIDQLKRPQKEVEEGDEYERAAVERAYCQSRNALVAADDRWIRTMIKNQDAALAALKQLSPDLYNAAVQRESSLLCYTLHGPKLTPPLQDYAPPDGDYFDTTRTYVEKTKTAATK